MMGDELLLKRSPDKNQKVYYDKDKLKGLKPFSLATPSRTFDIK